MEEPEAANESYLTHGGKQSGLVSLDDVKYEAERGEPNSRLDMLWKNGTQEWMPPGDLGMIFSQKKEEKKGSSFKEFEPELARRRKRNWSGNGEGRAELIVLS